MSPFTFLCYFLAWSAFNASVGDSAPPKNTVGYLQPVNESPTQLPAMYTVLKRSQYFAQLIELQEVDTVFDQACFAKACIIKWASPVKFENINLRLGAFHTIPVFISVIFKNFGDAGLIDIIAKSGLVASGSLCGVITGHHYNRAVWTLKIVYEALARLHWKQFGDYVMETEDLNIDPDLIQAKVLDMREEIIQKEFKFFMESNQVQGLFLLNLEFCEMDRRPMFKLWVKFLKMKSLLLAFIRARREGNWPLHLACFRGMLPWFFAYDQTNYARYGAYYLSSMRVLESTHPQTHEQLMNGHFAVQLSSTSPFAKIPEDQTIEETINRDSKIPGGIIGKSRHPQAVGQWVDTAADRSQITDNMRNIAGISESAPGLHKEAGPSHMKADEQSVRDVLTVITSMKDPFMHSEVLTSISTGVQATEATKENLSSAPSKGEQCLREFMQDIILTKETPFYEPLQKMKLSTFSTQVAEKVVKVSGKEMRI